MNILEANVVEVLTDPYRIKDSFCANWFVKIKASCHGKDVETTEMFRSEEEAFKLSVGDTVRC